MTDHQGRIKVLNVKRTSGNDFWSKNKHERLLWLQTMKAHAETGVWREKHRVVLHAVKNVVINHVCFVQVQCIYLFELWCFGVWIKSTIKCSL